MRNTRKTTTRFRRASVTLSSLPAPFTIFAAFLSVAATGYLLTGCGAEKGNLPVPTSRFTAPLPQNTDHDIPANTEPTLIADNNR